ncbi:hypothetical protein [Bradyrhizobium sp. DASA03007]|uniref:hypothetical protein n=1 Tax=unclassified Bradyrhizobium TaxID=2631580 RepID=UPI003F711D1B
MTTVKGQLLQMLQTVAQSLGDELRERHLAGIDRVISMPTPALSLKANANFLG